MSERRDYNRLPPDWKWYATVLAVAAGVGAAYWFALH